jgi:hypothetical protein
VRGDNNVVFAGESSALAIASTPEEHMLFWTGEGGHGLYAHKISGRGDPIGTVIEVLGSGPFGPIEAAAGGDQYAVALQQTGPTQRTRSIIVDADGTLLAGGEEGIRLSQDSFSIPFVAVSATSAGFFFAWEDLRHVAATPPLQAIYHNGLRVAGQVWFASDRAVHADVGVELGGVAEVGEAVLVLSRDSRGLGVLVLPSDDR